jgi:hypothetical protein
VLAVFSIQEQSIREEIMSDLLADKGEAAQISTAERVLAEISRVRIRCWSRSITLLTA